MSSERIQLSQEQLQRIVNILQKQGVSLSIIDLIVNGEYATYHTEDDIENSLGGINNYGDILEMLSEGFAMKELQEHGISQKKIYEFQKMLQEKGITVDNAKAIYQYSVGSNMILGVKRGTSKEKIRRQIMQDLEESLMERGVHQTKIEKVKQFLISTDYKKALHSNYKKINEYMEQIGIDLKARVSARRAMQSMDRCAHIDETIHSLEEGLSRTSLPKSMKLYRAVKSKNLNIVLQQDIDLTSLVGKIVSNKGQMSTSPLYDSSFAKYDDYDIVFEIYVPRGSRGSYITELSAYDKAEQEVLLNSNDLYITNVKKDIIDKNGKRKTIIQALALSKDKECYKEKGKSGLQQQMQDQSEELQQD